MFRGLGTEFTGGVVMNLSSFLRFKVGPPRREAGRLLNKLNTWVLGSMNDPE